MPRNIRESARQKQAENPKILSTIDDPLLLPLEKTFTPRESRLDPSGVYSEQDLVHNFQIRPEFFREAREGKLHQQKRKGDVRLLKPLDIPSKQFFYLGSEVLAFLAYLSS